MFLSLFILFSVALKWQVTSPRFAGFSRELALEENLAKRVMGDSPAKRLALIARVAGARWAKGAKRILPIGLRIGDVRFSF